VALDWTLDLAFSKDYVELGLHHPAPRESAEASASAAGSQSGDANSGGGDNAGDEADDGAAKRRFSLPF
jgi:hypothetical protein